VAVADDGTCSGVMPPASILDGLATQSDSDASIAIISASLIVAMPLPVGTLLKKSLISYMGE